MYNSSLYVSIKQLLLFTFRFLQVCTAVIILAGKSESNIEFKKISGEEIFPIRYADSKHNPLVQYFDRLVAIVVNATFKSGYMKSYRTLVPGVIFDRNHVLTAFNPFRQLMKIKAAKKAMVVVSLSRRTVNETHTAGYKYNTNSINCYGQVVTISEDTLTDEQWFGKNYIHSPVHDLLVMRINKPYYRFKEESDLTQFEDMFQKNDEIDSKLNLGRSKKKSWIEAGPLLTKLAQPEDKLGRKITVACLGCADDPHIWRHTDVKTMQFDDDERSLEDCDAWLPRTWGYFICVKNKERFEGLGSGAVLIYDEKLFGIGSFMLDKINDSILVFTDVRQYYGHIQQRCRKPKAPFILPPSDVIDMLTPTTTEPSSDTDTETEKYNDADTSYSDDDDKLLVLPKLPKLPPGLPPIPGIPG